jgi:glycosyltransferase involved in cell wall biosynthesis
METNKKRLRILVASNAIWAPSGYAQQARQFVPMIRDEGYPIAMSNFYGQEGGIFILDGITMYPKIADQWGADAMVEHSRDFKADVVISLQDSWVLDLNAIKQLGQQHVRYIPLVPIDHEPIPPAVKERMDQAFRIISMSPYGERELRRVGLHSTYIPHTVETQVFKRLGDDKAEFKKMLGIPEDHFVFGMVSANKDNPPRKGFQYVMDAFKVFHDKYPKSSMYFHTQPRQNGGFQVEEYARVLGYGKDVFFPMPYNLLFKVQPADMVKIFNSFDCLLCPSTNEGFGIPIIEAGACEVPVISNDFTSMRDLVKNGETGYKTKVREKRYTLLGSYIGIPDQDDLTRLMLKMYEDTDRIEMGKNARKFVVDNFDLAYVFNNHWKPFLERLEHEIYDLKF